MPSDTAVFAAQFAALGDETRLALVERLRRGPSSIVGLTGDTDMTRQAITKHLRVLEKAGLVRSMRVGRTTIWYLERLKFDTAHDYLALVSRQWDDALDRLRVQVEH